MGGALNRASDLHKMAPLPRHKNTSEGVTAFVKSCALYWMAKQLCKGWYGGTALDFVLAIHYGHDHMPTVLQPRRNVRDSIILPDNLSKVQIRIYRNFILLYYFFAQLSYRLYSRYIID